MFYFIAANLSVYLIYVKLYRGRFVCVRERQRQNTFCVRIMVWGIRKRSGVLGRVPWADKGSCCSFLHCFGLWRVAPLLGRTRRVLPPCCLSDACPCCVGKPYPVAAVSRAVPSSVTKASCSVVNGALHHSAFTAYKFPGLLNNCCASKGPPAELCALCGWVESVWYRYVREWDWNADQSWFFPHACHQGLSGTVLIWWRVVPGTSWFWVLSHVYSFSFHVSFGETRITLRHFRVKSRNSFHFTMSVLKELRMPCL